MRKKVVLVTVLLVGILFLNCFVLAGSIDNGEILQNSPRSDIKSSECSQPIFTFTGPTKGLLRENLEFCAFLLDFEGKEFYLYLDWGDGDIEEWIGPYLANEEIIKSHVWNDSGTYTIQATADYDGSLFNVTWNVTILNPNPLFTFTGPIKVIEGYTYEYTVYVEPNPYFDEYRIRVDWIPDMLIWEYPEDEKAFHTGVNGTIKYRWSHWLYSWAFDVEAWVKDNYSLKDTLTVHVVKHPTEFRIYGWKNYNIEVINNRITPITFDVDFSMDWMAEHYDMKIGPFPVEALDEFTVTYDYKWEEHNIYFTKYDITTSEGDTFTRHGITIFGYNIYFPSSPTPPYVIIREMFRIWLENWLSEPFWLIKFIGMLLLSPFF